MFRVNLCVLLILFFAFSSYAKEPVIGQPDVTGHESSLLGPLHYELLPRKSEIPTFPCSKCHKHLQSGVSHASLKVHGNLTFKHMPDVKNCGLCHRTEQPDELHLLDGTAISFDESYRICVQCHGKEGYNWHSGMHGRVIGMWNGKRSVYNCAFCHQPHNPAFKPMQTVAEPRRPKFLIDKGEEH